MADGFGLKIGLEGEMEDVEAGRVIDGDAALSAIRNKNGI